MGNRSHFTLSGNIGHKRQGTIGLLELHSTGALLDKIIKGQLDFLRQGTNSTCCRLNADGIEGVALGYHLEFHLYGFLIGCTF